MVYASWLADAARAWGLTVTETNGWQTRGNSSFSPRGGVAHHTAGPTAGGDMPSLNVLINGRADLAGPLCHYGLGRSGTVYVVAAGVANHAGKGGWQDLSGNSSVVGIEAENDGYQPWPEAQTVAYATLAAAVCDATGIAPAMWCRHHEWRPEKPDPHSIDGAVGREAIAQRLALGPEGTTVKGRRRMDLCTSPDGRVAHFVIGSDQAVYWTQAASQEQLTGAGYDLIGGEAVSVAATWTGDGSALMLTVQGTDNRCYLTHYDPRDKVWRPWTKQSQVVLA